MVFSLLSKFSMLSLNGLPKTNLYHENLKLIHRNMPGWQNFFLSTDLSIFLIIHSNKIVDNIITYKHIFVSCVNFWNLSILFFVHYAFHLKLKNFIMLLSKFELEIISEAETFKN